MGEQVGVWVGWAGGVETGDSVWTMEAGPLGRLRLGRGFMRCVVCPAPPCILLQRVLKYVDVDLRPSRFVYVMWTILTCGIYLLFLKYCPFCCWRRVDVDRGRLLVTSAGRVGMWRNVQAGLKKGATIKMQSNVNILWFSVKNLTSVHVSRSFRWPILARCCPRLHNKLDVDVVDESVTLRLFFNTFPKYGRRCVGLCGRGGPGTGWKRGGGWGGVEASKVFAGVYKFLQGSTVSTGGGGRARYAATAC